MGQMITSSERAREIGKLGGRKPGPITQVRKMELAQRKAMEKMIYRKTAPLIRAGMMSAMGQNFVYRIDEEEDSKGKVISRKHVLVEDPHEIAEALDRIEEGGKDPEDKYYYVTTKEPDIRAIEALLNRGFGKPKESLEVTGEVAFSLRALASHRGDILDEDIKAKAIDVSKEHERSSDALIDDDTNNNNPDELS